MMEAALDQESPAYGLRYSRGPPCSRRATRAHRAPALAGALAPQCWSDPDVRHSGQPARHHQLLALEVRAEEARKTPTIGIRVTISTSSMRRRAWAMRPFVSGTL